MTPDWSADFLQVLLYRSAHEHRFASVLEGIYQFLVRHLRGLSSFRRGKLDVAAFGNLLGHCCNIHDRLPVQPTGHLENSRSMY